MTLKLTQKLTIALLVGLFVLSGCSQQLSSDPQSEPSTQNEYDGIVYKGLLLKNVSENEWGWHIRALSKELDIEMGVLESNEKFRDAIIPVNFYLKRGDVKLLFKGNVDRLDAEHLMYPETANITYKVYKDNKEINLEKTPFTYRRGGPYLDLNELLEALEIKYFKDGATTYIDSDGKTEILGKVLTRRNIESNDNKNIDLQLVYYYKKLNDPNYDRIDFVVNGNQNSPVKIYDEKKRGSSEYYQNGMVDYLNYKNEDFIQVALEKDTVIFRYEDGRLVPIFTKANYEKYLGGSLTLETYENGKSIYIDKVNDVTKEIQINNPEPNLIFNLNISDFGRMEQDYATNKLKLIAHADAIYDGKTFFSIELEFIYNGSIFVPSLVTSTDWARYGNDKRNEKLIESMKDYRWFEYRIQ
jgi:hypothetical protein